MNNVVNGSYDYSRVLISCIFADGVAIFWMISGFFLFNNTDYKKVLKRTLNNIGIPLLLFSLFYFYFEGWLIKGESLFQSIHHSSEEYILAFKMLLAWKNPVVSAGHLWYLYVYILIMIIFPVLKLFVDYLEKDIVRLKYFIVMSVGFFFMNDITANQLAQFSHHSINGLIPASIELIWGYFIYKYREKFLLKKYMPIAMIAFFGTNMIRAKIQLNHYNMEPVNKSLIFWYSIVGAFCAFCVIVFCFSFVNSKRNCVKINNAICKLASYTFEIYLWHYVVKNVLNRFHFQEILRRFIFQFTENFVAEIIYTIIIIGSVFIISLVIAICIEKIKVYGNSFFHGIVMNKIR